MDSLTAADIMARSEATLSPDSDIYDALARLLKSKLTGAPVVDGDGSLKLDFTFVDDTANGIFLAATRPEASAETFNITRGEAFSLSDAIEIIRSKIGKLDLEYGPVPEHIPVRGTLDITKARNLLGYSPEYDLERGLGIYIDHLNANVL